jgi:hypothetical protein
MIDAVGFELRLDLNASAGRRLLYFLLADRADPNPRGFRLCRFVGSKKLVKMARVGIQVEAELEPYRSIMRATMIGSLGSNLIPAQRSDYRISR